jgi:hypothetical protein
MRNSVHVKKHQLAPKKLNSGEVRYLELPRSFVWTSTDSISRQYVGENCGKELYNIFRKCNLCTPLQGNENLSVWCIITSKVAAYSVTIRKCLNVGFIGMSIVRNVDQLYLRTSIIRSVITEAREAQCFWISERRTILHSELYGRQHEMFFLGSYKNRIQDVCLSAEERVSHWSLLTK